MSPLMMDEAELDRRLQVLQAQIDLRALANPNADTTARFSTSATPPSPTGLTLVPTVAGIVVEWQPVQILDLATYELQIDEVIEFSNPTTVSWTTTRFPFTNAVAGRTYFIRVRSVNIAGNASLFSAILNTKSGFVTTSTIGVQAASEISRFLKASGFSKIAAGANKDTGTVLTETYGPITLTIFDGAVVVDPRVITQCDLKTIQGGEGEFSQLTFDFLRRPAGSGENSDVVVDTGTSRFNSPLPNDNSPFNYSLVTKLVLPGFTTFDIPGTGQWEYRAKLTASASGAAASIQFQVTKLLMEMHQNKR